MTPTHPLLFLAAYTPITALLLWWLLPTYRARLLARYREFDQWLEAADERPLIAYLDDLSKLILVVAGMMMAGVAVACLIIVTLTHAN